MNKSEKIEGKEMLEKFPVIAAIQAVEVSIRDLNSPTILLYPCIDDIDEDIPSVHFHTCETQEEGVKNKIKTLGQLARYGLQLISKKNVSDEEMLKNIQLQAVTKTYMSIPVIEITLTK